MADDVYVTPMLPRWVDYDGTLTEQRRPDDQVMAALHARGIVADGPGIAGSLLGPFLQGFLSTEPRHWHITLGRQDDGAPVTIPTSAVDVEIYGASGTGKSHTAGLIAEQLIEKRYIVCVIDLEGDHAPPRDDPRGSVARRMNAHMRRPPSGPTSNASWTTYLPEVMLLRRRHCYTTRGCTPIPAPAATSCPMKDATRPGRAHRGRA